MTRRRASGAEECDRTEADPADRDAADVGAGSEPRTDRADGGAEAGRTVDVDEGRLRLPTDTTPAETAAIAAAVGAHLRDEAAAAADADAAAAGDDGWDGRRWAFAGRADALAGCPVRATDGTPTDAWTAMGRADRLRRL